MEIFPAIDILSGKVVRLKHGDYQDRQHYADDPAEMAARFLKEGARNLHVVDLDGAKDGQTVNFEAIRRVAATGGLFIQVGGGIRDEKRIERYLELGIGRVILGTVALENFTFVERAVKQYGEHIAVGVDARNGLVATHGWQNTSKTDAFTFCERLRDAGVETVIYTDIEKDGALSGTNMDAYRRLRQINALKIVASGGISYESEIAGLRDLGNYAAILGKALYEKKLCLKRALIIADGKEEL